VSQLRTGTAKQDSSGTHSMCSCAGRRTLSACAGADLLACVLGEVVEPCIQSIPKIRNNVADVSPRTSLYSVLMHAAKAPCPSRGVGYSLVHSMSGLLMYSSTGGAPPGGASRPGTPPAQ